MELSEMMKIAAFLPGYKVGVGQGTEIIFRDGTIGWLTLGVRSFTIKLANIFALNLKEMRRRFGPIVGQKNLVPLALAPFFLYVPLKAKTPLVVGDPAYGYFRLRSILSVNPNPQPCTLQLEGGYRLTLNQSYRTVREKLRAARKLESFMLELSLKALEGGPLACGSPSGFAAFRQENGPFYGIIDAKGEKGGPPMELKNLMEDLVRQRLDEITASDQDFCRCEQCRLDITAIALNELPPRYVVTQRGETYSKADILEIQRYVDVVAAVTKAVQTVGKNPRHQRQI